jgi:hypothetical protein
MLIRGWCCHRPPAIAHTLSARMRHVAGELAGAVEWTRARLHVWLSSHFRDAAGLSAGVAGWTFLS